MTSLLIEEGWSALRQGELAAARRSFEIALAEDESGEVLDGLAVALYLECEYRDAAALFERAYAAYHSSGDHRAAGFTARFVAWIRGNVLGDWAVESGWFARALAMFESAGDDSSDIRMGARDPGPVGAGGRHHAKRCSATRSRPAAVSVTLTSSSMRSHGWARCT